MRSAYIKTLLLFIVSFILVCCGPGERGGLKGKIQKELNKNPFLQETEIKLKVIEEENGYVTIEMFEGSRKIRDKIDKGHDIFSIQFEQDWLWLGASQEEKKGVNALRKSLNYVKKMDGVKDVVLTAAVNTPIDRARTFFDQSIDWYQKGKYDRAIADLNKALEIEPQFTRAYYFRANIWGFKIKNYDRSIADFNKVLEINPQHVRALSNLAWVFATCPNPKYQNGVKAVKFALKATSQEPNAWNVIGTLSAAYARNGQFEKAIETAEKSVRLLKNDMNYSETKKQKNLKGAYERLNLYKKHQAYAQD